MHGMWLKTTALREKAPPFTYAWCCFHISSIAKDLSGKAVMDEWGKKQWNGGASLYFWENGQNPLARPEVLQGLPLRTCLASCFSFSPWALNTLAFFQFLKSVSFTIWDGQTPLTLPVSVKEDCLRNALLIPLSRSAFFVFNSCKTIPFSFKTLCPAPFKGHKLPGNRLLVLYLDTLNTLNIQLLTCGGLSIFVE